MPITQNPHFIAAYNDYQEALRMCRHGLIGNASVQRERLRYTYRLLAGKV